MRGGGRRAANGTRWVLIWTCALGVALLAAPLAGAQEPPPEETALVDQYKEMIPTASGPKASGGGGNGGTGGGAGTGGGGAPLPPALVTELNQAVGEEDAKRLEEISTSPRFGAPAVHPPDEGGLLPEGSAPSVFSAAVDGLAGESGGSLLPLLLAIVFSTGALFGAAFHRRRQRLT